MWSFNDTDLVAASLWVIYNTTTVRRFAHSWSQVFSVWTCTKRAGCGVEGRRRGGGEGPPSSSKPAHSWKSPWRVNGATKLRLHPWASDVSQRYIRGGTLLTPTHLLQRGGRHMYGWHSTNGHQSPMEAGTSSSSSSWFSNFCELPENNVTTPSRSFQHHHEPNVQHFSPSSPLFSFIFFPRTQNQKTEEAAFLFWRRTDGSEGTGRIPRQLELRVLRKNKAKPGASPKDGGHRGRM